MQTQTLQELVVLLVIMAVAALVFWQTGQFSEASSGQISPGTFPRLVAGAMAVCAVVKIVLLLTRTGQACSKTLPAWNRETLLKPVGASVLMIVYVFLFGKVPFFPLTAAFVLAIFLVFGVRPWRRLLIGALIATVFMYVLFTRLLSIAV